MMEFLGLMLWHWFMHAGIAGLLAWPFLFFGRNRAHWREWEVLVFVLPFLPWAFCETLDGSANSLKNLAQLFVITISIPIAAAIRVLIGRRKHQFLFSGALLLTICGVAVSAYLLTPSLLE